MIVPVTREKSTEGGGGVGWGGAGKGKGGGKRRGGERY